MTNWFFQKRVPSGEREDKWIQISSQKTEPPETWVLARTIEKARFEIQPTEKGGTPLESPTAGVVFEIQVVLKDMLLARSSLDGHAAYERFREKAECAVAVGGFDAELQKAMSPSTSVGESNHLDAVLLKTENDQLRSEIIDLRAKLDERL